MRDLFCRSVDINELEAAVEGEVNSVCQFHFVFLRVQLKFSHSCSFIVLLQVVLDGLRDELAGHDALLAVNLSKVALPVELQLRAILQNDVIASAENAGLNRGEHDLLTLEVFAEQGLGLGREFFNIDRFVVAGICYDIE